MPKYARNASTTKFAPGWASSAVGPTLDITSLISEKTGHLRTVFFFFFFLGIFRRYRLFLVHGVDGGAGTWLCGPEISNRSLPPSLFWWLIAGEIWRRLLCSWQGTWTIDQADVSAVLCHYRNIFWISFFASFSQHLSPTPLIFKCPPRQQQMLVVALSLSLFSLVNLRARVIHHNIRQQRSNSQVLEQLTIIAKYIYLSFL